MDRLEDLTETEQMIRQTVDQLADEYDDSYTQEVREEERLPTELMEEFADLGFLGMMVPEEYGGQDMAMKEMAILVERLNYRGLGTPHLLTSATMAPPVIKRYASEELKERFLPEIASGEARICAGITEAEAGTNTAKIQTEAVRDGDEYVVNGEKYYISAVAHSDHIQLISRTKPYEEVKDDDPYDGVTILLVPTDADGVSYEPLDLDSPGAVDQFAVNLDDVRVPVENRIGQEDKGFIYMFDAINPERIFFGASSVGTGNRAIEKAVDHATDRVVFDDPIGAYQGIQHPLAEAKIDLELVWLATLKCAEAYDDGRENIGAYSNIINYAGSEAQWKAANAAMQPFGGQAFMPEHGMVSTMIRARLTQIAPLNNEMVLNHVAERVLGLPRSY
jgi:acyl-CoA dehydrogenase